MSMYKRLVNTLSTLAIALVGYSLVSIIVVSCHNHSKPPKPEPVLAPTKYYLLNPKLSPGNISVQSLSPDNTITTASSEFTLDQYATKTLAIGSDSFITGTGPFTIAGEADATDLSVPAVFEGTEFVIPHFRNAHTYYLLSPKGNAKVTVSLGSDSTQLTLTEGQVATVEAGSDNTLSGIIRSNTPILVSHTAAEDTATQDAFPVAPASLEAWGIRSAHAIIGALEDNTTITVYTSDRQTATYNLNAGGRQEITVGSVAEATQGQGVAIHIVADKPIAAIQADDGDGLDATVFFATPHLGSRHGIPIDSQYVAVACSKAKTIIILHDGTKPPITKQCSGDGNYPGKAYFGVASDTVSFSAGSYLESNNPIYAIYEAALHDDEHNTLGSNQVNGVPAPTVTTQNGITRDNNITVAGSAQPGDVINIYINGQLVQSTTTDTNGNYTDTVVLNEGNNEIHTTIADTTSENESFPSTSLNVPYIPSGRVEYYFIDPQTAVSAFTIVSMVDSNRLFVGNKEYLLDTNEVVNIPSATLISGDVVWGSGAFSIGSDTDSTDTPSPASFLGLQFVIPHQNNEQSNEHRYYLYSPQEIATVTITLGDNKQEQVTVPANEVVIYDAGSTNDIAGRIVSDKLIAVTHQGHTSGASLSDIYAVPPAATELWGVKNKKAYLGALEDGTSITVYSSDQEQLTYSLNAGEVQEILLSSDVSENKDEDLALHIVANKPVSAIQQADGDGNESTAFWPGTYHATDFVLPVATQYVAVACQQPDTEVTLADASTATVIKITCNAVGEHPGRAFFGSPATGVNINAFSTISTDKPIYLYYETATSNDEHNLFGFNLGEASTNVSPVITSTPVPNVQVNGSYSYEVIATDGDDDPLTYTLTQSPAGMRIDSTRGLISWTATAAVIGANSVTVQVSDGRGGVDTQNFTVTVSQSNHAPVITSTPVTLATIDQAYTYQVVADDADSDVLSYRLITSPLGMNINATTGLINWQVVNLETSNVVIEVNDANGGIIQQQYSVSTSYPENNQPPVFPPLSDQTVPIGTTLTLTFAAEDTDVPENSGEAGADNSSDSNAISYSITPLPLPPNAILNVETGVLTFTPQAGQAGVYNFVVRASDSRFSTTQPLKITVPSLDVNAGTSFHGRILDAISAEQNTELPVVGATVSFLETDLSVEGASTVTDAQGYFTLKNIPPTAEVFSIDSSTANLAPGGASYASFREKMTLIEHANNVEERPFYMPRNNMASMTQVDPNQTTVVQNTDIDVSLEIPPNTATNDDGTPYIGQISISEVPDGLEPESMPENFNPSLLVTIQPAGVRFTTPVPITFPNVDKLPVGTELAIMSVDPDTGVFEEVGTARVSSDGQRIETVSGGIREADWHFPTIQAVDKVEVSISKDPGTCPVSSGSTTCLKDGRMSQTVGLPVYRSLEANRAVALTYQTSRAGQVAQALQNLGSRGFSNGQRIGVSISYKQVRGSVSSVGGASRNYVKITNTIAGIRGKPKYLSLPPPGQPISLTGVTLDIPDDLSTGLYTVTTSVVVYVGASVSGVVNKTETMIINEAHSPFGAGWMIANIDRLHFHEDTKNALLVSSDGRYKIYDFDKNSNLFLTPKGNFSVLFKNNDDSYTLTDQFGNQSFFNSLGLQTERKDLNGNSTFFNYNADNELTQVTDPVGKQTLFSYSNHRISSITDPANRVTTFEHDSLGNLTEISYPDNSAMKYEYVGHLLTKKRDERNNLTEYHYDEDGFNTHVTLPDNKQRGVASALSKGFGGSNTTVENPQETVVDTRTGTYVNARGNISSSDLDDRSYATKSVDAIGRVTLYERDANSLPLKTTRPNGSVITKTFDRLGNTTSEREEFNGALYQYIYDHRSLLTSFTNPNNHSVTITRDDSGNPIKIVNHLGHTTTIDYDTRGLPIRIVTPNKLIITHSYNSDGLLETQTETPPDGSPGEVRTSKYQYFPSGLLKQLNTADGRTYTYTYDPRSRPLTITDNLNQKQTIQYDNYGNVTATDTTNADGTDALHVEYRFDNRNRLTETRQPHKQTDAITQLILDGESNITQLIDPKGSIQAMHYDKVDRLDKNTHRLNGLSEYSYDLNDKITKVITPNGATTDYTYDLLGRRLSEISPDRGTIQYEYDVANNLTKQIDGRGIITLYTYDELERMSTKTFPSNPVEDVILGYDECSLGLGRLCNITDETGNSSYEYDGWGNITKHNKTELSKNYTTTYAYDKGNNISKTTYPGGRVITITRDGVRRMQSIQASLNQNGTPTNQTLMDNSLYRADNQITQCSFGNGLTESRSYDLQGRIVSQSTNSGPGITDQRLYDYDINSNLINRTGTVQTSAYDYDLLDRLTQDNPSTTANLQARQSTLEYDLNHNRLGKISLLPDAANTQSTQTKAYSYRSFSNQLLAEETLTQGLPLIAKNKNETLEYNAANRLSKLVVTNNDNGLIVTTDYLYNAHGQRTRKTKHLENGATDITIYHYNLEGQLISETTETGESIRDYIWHSMSPVAQVEHNQAASNDTVYYLHRDHLYTPRFATNTEGGIIWRFEGEAFGETNVEDDVDGNGVNVSINLRFPGQYFDEESGFFYNYFRYYDPSTGRYITSDPIGLAAGVNTYGYVGQNPVYWSDRYGLAPDWDWYVDGIGGFTDFLLNHSDEIDSPVWDFFAQDFIDTTNHLRNQEYGGAGFALACGLFKPLKGVKNATKRGTETIQRAMSRGELEAIQNSGVLSRGGRPGPHFVSDAVNSTANRARQRLALPGSPEVRVTMDVPKGVFSSPSKVKPKFNMPGGGMERTAPGHLDIPATIRRVDGL